MNGWTFAAVAAMCVTVLAVALLWAVVRLAQRDAGARPAAGAGEAGEVSADEAFVAVRERNARGQADLRRRIAEAAERARRERAGEL